MRLGEMALECRLGDNRASARTMGLSEANR